MLSRVAENIYWMARYIERVENTARLISAATNLMLDLPKGMRQGWGPLIAIAGCDEIYRKRHDEYGERAVLRFMIGAKDNPDSILESLQSARENCRTIRDIVPREVWEQINALYFFGGEHMQEGLTKRGRHPFLKQIVLRCQTIAGKVSGTMNRDQGYQFLRLGYNIERADMTTRILDVSSADLLHEDGPDLEPFASTRWMAVLNSISAYQMYRRSQQPRVQRSAVVRFVLQDTAFPRAVYYCINQVEAGISLLPRNASSMRVIGRLKRSLTSPDIGGLDQESLHAFIDELQVTISELHQELSGTWFLPPPATASNAD
ncbi:MAG: alpha-E domain-containing protein [Chromatiaceae bacterium]|jgi:uncharacterized alpha-E superfamily protein|nr:alpha-E domain-containing protein [Chromatiaceae bacterium]